MMMTMMMIVKKTGTRHLTLPSLIHQQESRWQLKLARSENGGLTRSRLKIKMFFMYVNTFFSCFWHLHWPEIMVFLLQILWFFKLNCFYNRPAKTMIRIRNPREEGYVQNYFPLIPSFWFSVLKYCFKCKLWKFSRTCWLYQLSW